MELKNQGSYKHNQAIAEVQWLLQESYKMAVKLRGVQDWSQSNDHDETLVESYQLKIAELLHKSLVRQLG